MTDFRDIFPPPPWEGPPVPRGWLQEEPPTPAQLHYIAVLCQKLNIKEPLEERVRTRGEAGKLIRELEAKTKYRGLPSSNPGRMRIWVGISPGSWGGSLREYAPRKSYLVEDVSEAIELAKRDPYFKPYFDKIHAAGYKKMSFTWGTEERWVHRHRTESFEVPGHEEHSSNPRFVYRAAPERLRPPGWEPRKPYPEELSYTLTPEQEQYLISEVRKAYRARPGPTQHFVELARRYAEADLWVQISDEKAQEIARKAILF